jgi:hypothetical protein
MQFGADGVAGQTNVATEPTVEVVDVTVSTPPLLVQVNPLVQAMVTPEATPVKVTGVVALAMFDAVTNPVEFSEGTAVGMAIDRIWPPGLPVHVSCMAISGLLPVAGMELHTQSSAAVAVPVQ